MRSDREGFRYPVIDAAQCVGCRLCEKVCPVLNPAQNRGEPSVYAAKNKDAEVRRLSSSGGVFTTLAEMILADGGAVCAAKYDADFRVVHDMAYTKTDLAAFRGAKYAQSRAEHCFPVIRKLLNEGRPVLFVGTPCQSAGLNRYLGAADPRLLTVDMICHGVPSPKVWERYLQDRKQADGADPVLRTVDLRSKATGWSRYGYTVKMTYENGKEYAVPQGQDFFMQGFVKNLYLRDSCARCGFKGTARCSDLTLGDFWGIWDLKPEFDDDRGTSLLAVHSAGGQRAWERIQHQFEAVPMSWAEAVRYNPSAVESSVPHPDRQAFFAQLEQGGSVICLIRDKLVRPVEKPSLFQRIRNRLRRGE